MWKTNKQFRAITIVTISALLVVIAGVSALYCFARSGPQEQYPSPNGYEFIRQATLVIGDRLHNAELLPDKDLASYLQQNSEALELTRKGLALPSVVPVEFTQTWIASQTKVMMGARDLGYAFEAEALLYKRQGNIDQALSSALDLVHLGFSLGNRGVLINFMLGSACEIQGVHVISNMLDHFTAPQCRSAIRILAELDRQRESIDLMFQRERRWSVKAGGILEYVKFMIEHRSLHPETKVWNSIAEVRSRLRELRRFRIQIAIKAFELDQGSFPTNASDLVPAYLKELPLDPESGDQMPIQPAQITK